MNVFQVAVVLVLSGIVVAGTASASDETLRRGSDLYIAHCALCHGNLGLGDGALALTLPDYPPTNLAVCGNDCSSDRVRRAITRGSQCEDISPYMPPWEGELAPEEIELLVKFIGFLRNNPDAVVSHLARHSGQARPTWEQGRALYEARCLSCHGQYGAGDGRMARVVNNPPPANLRRNNLDAKQMRAVIELGGAETGRSYQMPPWRDELTQNDVSSVIRYIKTLKTYDEPGSAPDVPDPEDFSEWRLPESVLEPGDNRSNPARIALGRELFFDPMLSSDFSTSCASCHDPDLGWSDGRAKAIGVGGHESRRSSPSIVNVAYNKVQMWDGRFRSLEQQARAPIENPGEMNLDADILASRLQADPQYVKAFGDAYPGAAIDLSTAAKALAVFQRTIVHRNSAFDRWLEGDRDAMTPAQLRGLQVFVDEDRGNCAACHQAPNFADNGFHNIGFDDAAAEKDPGRYELRPLPVAWGAFKTPSLRDVERTAPYFHDGRARTLRDVIEHYDSPDLDAKGISPNMKALALSRQEKRDLEAFLHALTSDEPVFARPETGTDRRFAGRRVE